MEAIINYINQQTAEQRVLMQQLRQIILESAPHVEEGIKWKIPFYSYKGLLCYLNPKPKAVVLGFCRGALLSNQQGLLEGDGKEVRLLRINCGGSCPTAQIKEILQEAILINEALQQRKNYYV